MENWMNYLPDFGQALLVTLGISFAGAAFGLLLGFVLNALRLAVPGFIGLYRLYVWLVRGTPFLAQLLLIYFGLPVLGLTLDAVQASILALGLYSAAYFAELLRSAWASVPNGQLEAARVHGLSGVQTFWHIQAPQAMAFALPLLGNQVILTIKESAVASIITVPELTMTAGQIVSSTFSYVVPYVLLVLSYWLLTLLVGFVAAGLGRRATRYLRG
ncbi:amino acid ABC transporter permease [Ectopseudomonas mendocina]|jgi:His/Glu/Gln/Arg/opine family amino acid ABC transporter permease subunit|uniref:Amino acid ABC transporter permease n=2 Tax=Ectopseudomonas TaxID=3236654 RepID=A0A2R3QMS6_ECTME|nr:amino acid ABC transporter permease [Pseudomonas mendocina]PZR48041.1 MAG: amino acid ABC transporter permease [Pseudomonas oleovorans]TRO21773.1 amino acid ABC transporter permease [Pseudomonas mendocina]TRO27874.1 amino acid ABC transporter permease [Pseudomonas mendocina]TRO43587.1 amino acid ABC transporter permease [Pseudomonas sp. ALS1279]|tara:strand:- start:119 stop:766 length:648 start_codon:yes stop_codon:yes gene_type:complete